MRIVRLERNYRSTKRILRIADELIGHNLRRKQKRLCTENDEGVPVRLVAYADQDHEAAGDRRADRSAIAAGRRKPSDFAIFYRVNALSRGLEQALRARHGIPYQMVRGQEFYPRKEIKDVLAYCQLVNNPARRHGIRADGQHAAPRHRQENDRPAQRARLSLRHAAVGGGPRRGAGRGPVEGGGRQGAGVRRNRRPHSEVAHGDTGEGTSKR